MTPGRNDPCPCGSGKKYKHCCGSIKSGSIKKNDWPSMFEQVTGLPAAMADTDDAHALMRAMQHIYEVQEELALVAMSDTYFGRIKADRIRTCRAGTKAMVKRSNARLKVAFEKAINRAGGNASKEILDAAFDQFRKDDNNLHQEELFGLSVNIHETWMVNEFNDYDALEIVTPEDLSQSPVMRYVDLMFKEALENKGRIRLTSSGSLNTLLVARCSDLWQELTVTEEDRNRGYSTYFYGRREKNFFCLEYARELVQECKFFSVREGYLVAKKTALAKYKKEGVRAFFYEMLRTACAAKDRSGYCDGPILEAMRPVWLFILWRMSKRNLCSEVRNDLMSAWPWHTAQIYMNMQPDIYTDPDAYMDGILGQYFLNDLMKYWGFARTMPNMGKRSEKYEVLPLFKETFKFEV